ncbi:MAG: ATP-dependent 6-phosphofructokinase, partial [Kistimonas sp.]|nr:ATP-dependent 6-phosphofructokinase [Kistimonas sp.]
AHIISRGGTVLKSARCMEFHSHEGREKAASVLKREGIDGLVVIGGDGSFTGADLLRSEFGVAVVGIPGTIDNDIYGTDRTIGYDTAVNTVMTAMDNIRDTATSHDRLFFIECMGRDSGFIGLQAGIAGGATEILIPEAPRTLPELVAKLQASRRACKSSSIILVAEGDQSGCVFSLAKQTAAQLPDYDVRVSVLGHIQRGGSPSCADRVLASQLGIAAVEQLQQGNAGIMVGVRNNALATTPLSDAISQKPTPCPDLLRVTGIISL